MEKKKNVPAVERAASLLELVKQNKKMTFTEICQSLQLAKSSAHLLINTLMDVGYLTRKDDGRYYLGLKLYELGAISLQYFDIRLDSVKCLEKLREKTTLTCHLGVRENLETIYLYKIDGFHSVIPSSWVGKRLSIHSSALGKVLLAWLSDSEQERIISQLEFTAKTPFTITDPERFKQALYETKKNALAYDNQEDVPDVRCMAAPIFDYHGDVIAAISTSGTVQQITEDNQKEIEQAVRVCAKEISELMGWKP